MSENDIKEIESLLKRTYRHFNERNIDATLAVMHLGVDWPNGMEGGIEHGHDAVRNYWTRQWKVFDPHVEPVQVEQQADGRIDVMVHQVVHDINGNLLLDQIVHHIYTIENGLIKAMDIRKEE